MPLSEEEQRILSEIEQQLYESDPALAKEIADRTIYRHATRNLKWGVAGFIAGTAMILGTLHISFVLAFLGFLIVLAATLSIVRDIRRLGRAGMEQLSSSVRANGLRDRFGDTGQRMRDRFRNRDEE